MALTPIDMLHSDVQEIKKDIKQLLITTTATQTKVKTHASIFGAVWGIITSAIGAIFNHTT